MIRVFMPDGKREKLRGKFRVHLSQDGPPILIVSHKGSVRSIDTIAMVFRGPNLAYSPRPVLPMLPESDRAFLNTYEAWGLVDSTGSMPAVCQVVRREMPSIQGAMQVSELAKEITERGFCESV